MAKKKNTAIIFWVFGLHRFYIGRYGSGVLQVLTAGGLLVWWFIDLLAILKGTIKDASGKTLEE